MLRALLDENVSLEVADRLKAFGYDVTAVAKHQDRGMSDEDVFHLAKDQSALLITRDTHFTNPIRFSPAQVNGILYISHSNLRSKEEADLVESFLKNHPPESFKGKLVFLTRSGATIR